MIVPYYPVTTDLWVFLARDLGTGKTPARSNGSYSARWLHCDGEHLRSVTMFTHRDASMLSSRTTVDIIIVIAAAPLICSRSKGPYCILQGSHEVAPSLHILHMAAPGPALHEHPRYIPVTIDADCITRGHQRSPHSSHLVDSSHCPRLPPRAQRGARRPVRPDATLQHLAIYLDSRRAFGENQGIVLMTPGMHWNASSRTRPRTLRLKTRLGHACLMQAARQSIV